MVKYVRREKYSKPQTLRELLFLAIKREASSMGFYADMVKHAFTLDMKKFINDLKNQELAHKRMLELKLKELYL